MKVALFDLMVAPSDEGGMDIEPPRYDMVGGIDAIHYRLSLFSKGLAYLRT